MRIRAVVRPAGILVVATACGPPIDVHPMNTTEVHREATANELTVGEPSMPIGGMGTRSAEPNCSSSLD
jgi:hypothetical protein